MTDSQIKQNIARNIARYRKQNHLTQHQLARLLHSKNTTVSTWERGGSTPDVEILFQLCRIFGISVVDLFGTDAVLNTDSLTVNGVEKNIVLAYRDSDELSKAMVLRTLALDPP